MDRGFSGGVALSLAGHLLFLGSLGVAQWIASRRPPITVNPEIAMMVPVPLGGGGTPNPEPPAPAATAPKAPEPKPEPPAPAPEPPPKVIKPPKEEPRKTLPDPDAKPVKKPKPEPTRPPATASVAQRGPARPASAGAGGTGRSSQTPGLEFAPPGPGVPTGTDPFGDWYLAGVQRKIWMLWTQQIQAHFRESIGVSFTILSDGSVTDVRVVQPSSISALNFAAQRAVMSAAPFGPLPREYGTNRYTVQAIFKPTAP